MTQSHRFGSLRRSGRLWKTPGKSSNGSSRQVESKQEKRWNPRRRSFRGMPGDEGEPSLEVLGDREAENEAWESCRASAVQLLF